MQDIVVEEGIGRDCLRSGPFHFNGTCGHIKCA